MWGLQFLCGSFFVLDPLWSYGMKSGYAEERFFQAPIFFLHMLGLLPIHEAQALQQLWQVACAVW